MTTHDTNSSETIADAVRGNWVDTRAPQRWRPYLRLMRADRPIGTWLLLLPCWQSLALAVSVDGPGWFDLWLAMAFAIGAFAMRGAGCAINDITDRDIDGRVERTRARPIPSGAISVRQALLFTAGLCLVGLAVLVTMNLPTIVLALAAMGPVILYPWMKRVTYWPQIFLGIAFNWGALVGWTAHMGALYWPPVLLYLGGIFWTLGYDTIYAHQDREDDALIGVKSTALLLGETTALWVGGFYAVSFALAVAAGVSAGLGWAFAIAALAYAAHLAWQVRRLDIHDGARCLTIFRSNREAGLILLGAILLGGVFA